MMTAAFSALHVLGAASFAPMARYSGFAATRSSAVGPRMVYNVDAALAVDGQSSMYNFADGAGTVAGRVGQRWGGYYDRGKGRGVMYGDYDRMGRPLGGGRMGMGRGRMMGYDGMQPNGYQPPPVPYRRGPMMRGGMYRQPGPAFQPYTDANSEALEAVDSGSSMYSFVDGTSTPQQRLRRSRWAGTQNPYAMNRRRRMLDMAAPYEDEMYGGGGYDVPPPPYDMAPPPYDEMPPPQPYDRMGMEPPPYDLERRIVELERALMGNGGFMGGSGMGGGMGMGGRLDWLDSQLGATSGPDMDRLSRLEDMARRQGLYDNDGGGYQQPGYQQPIPNGGYQQLIPNGGYQQPMPNGGYQQPGYQQNGGYQQPGYQQNGGYQQPGYQQNGGYQQPGYQQPGFQQQPSAGGNMFDNFGNSVSQLGNSVSNFFQGR